MQLTMANIALNNIVKFIFWSIFEFIIELLLLISHSHTQSIVENHFVVASMALIGNTVVVWGQYHFGNFC